MNDGNLPNCSCCNNSNCKCPKQPNNENRGCTCNKEKCSCVVHSEREK